MKKSELLSLVGVMFLFSFFAGESARFFQHWYMGVWTEHDTFGVGSIGIAGLIAVGQYTIVRQMQYYKKTGSLL